MKDTTRRILKSPSATTLVAANMIPIFGVLLGGWRIFPLVLLYWLENGIIGAITIPKILLARSISKSQPWKKPIPPAFTVIANAAMSVFFTLHYGMFLAVHGLFVVGMFGTEGFGSAGVERGMARGWSLLAEPGMLAAAAALAASHGWSFISNYCLGGQWRRTTGEDQMKAPYSRVAVLHVFIIASGLLAAEVGSPVPVLLLFVAMKTAVDLWAHVREHRKAKGAQRGHDHDQSAC
ncbi:MAG: DUF6498-containing protein [Planctomycetota bacterium]|jgi:hypothetical protein